MLAGLPKKNFAIPELQFVLQVGSFAIAAVVASLSGVPKLILHWKKIITVFVGYKWEKETRYLHLMHSLIYSCLHSGNAVNVYVTFKKQQ